jgi:hypothetical protein
MKASPQKRRQGELVSRPKSRTTTTNRARATIPPQEQPPYREFLDRNQGTLPEFIGKTHLDTLNSALGFLFARLREARRLFDQEGDNGRTGAFTALAAAWMFIVLFKEPLAESLQVPILRLQDALFGLDNNLVSPIVKPIRRRGRAPSSQAHATLKGHAAGTVRRLVDTGLGRVDAYKAVAKKLTDLGLRAERGPGWITATTVKNWCDEVSSDVSLRGTPALTYDSMFARPEEQRFSAMPKVQARRFALDSLAGWVHSVFPELQKPT